ncbi:hypothetical protein ACW0JT_23675 [Arthrobacter sp. SA17]
MHKIESNRDRTSEENRLRSHASTVTAWSAAHLDSDGNTLAYGVVLNNGSTTPIFDVALDAQDLLGKLRPLKLQLLPPGQYFVEALKDRTGWALPEHANALAGFTRPITRKAEWCVTYLQFRDAQNEAWRRSNTGFLDRVPLQEAAQGPRK